MGDRPRVYGVRSIGVAWQRPRLERFFKGAVGFVFLPPGVPPSRDLDGLAGWGAKGGARREAKRRGMPYLALEDGFLGAAAAGRSGYKALTLSADLDGIYYESASPSRLERLIEDWQSILPEELETARALMAVMRRENLGKFNDDPDATPEDLAHWNQPPVMVVDQIVGDRSIAGGGNDEGAFERMLDAAIAENPGVPIVARVHPLDGQGRRRGHLRQLAARRGVEVYDRRASWMSLVKTASRVYVASSQAGLEALIAGKPVTCFGQPFYAGWGLTDDRSPHPRRTARPTLDALVAATYLGHCRYLDPLTGEAGDALGVANLLAERRRRDRETEGLTHVYGVHLWKRFAVGPFLKGARSRLTWTMKPEQALARQRRQGGRIVAWASRAPLSMIEAAAAQGAPLHRIEDGFIRSVGLGSQLYPPASLVIDRSGIYYDPSGPSDLETLLETAEFDPALVERAGRLRRQVVALGVSKYNIAARSLSAFDGADGRARILVPGQVADDASVLRGGGLIRDNLALLKAVRAARPEGFIVYKPHPDVEAGTRIGALAPEALEGLADAVAANASIIDLLSACDEVHTLTSLVGFEGLMREKPVSVYGTPFYSGWGLTADHMTCDRRKRRLELDQLVAGVLLLYPRYADTATGWPCSAEGAVALINLLRMRTAGEKPLLFARWRWFIKGLFSAAV